MMSTSGHHEVIKAHTFYACRGKGTVAHAERTPARLPLSLQNRIRLNMDECGFGMGAECVDVFDGLFVARAMKCELSRE